MLFVNGFRRATSPPVTIASITNNPVRQGRLRLIRCSFAIFTSQRLVIHELSSPIAGKDRQPLLNAALNILTPNVVQQLPDYFHNIVCEQDADLWYQKMLSESRMLVIKTHDTQQLIGFIFAYTDGRHAHIG